MLTYTSNPQIRLLAGMIAASVIGVSHSEAVKLNMRARLVMSGKPKKVLGNPKYRRPGPQKAVLPSQKDKLPEWMVDGGLPPWWHARTTRGVDALHISKSILGPASTIGFGEGGDGESKARTVGELTELDKKLQAAGIDKNLARELARVSNVSELHIAKIMSRTGESPKLAYHTVVTKSSGGVEGAKKGLLGLPDGAPLNNKATEKAVLDLLHGRLDVEKSIQKLIAEVRTARASSSSSVPTGYGARGDVHVSSSRSGGTGTGFATLSSSLPLTPTARSVTSSSSGRSSNRSMSALEA